MRCALLYMLIVACLFSSCANSAQKEKEQLLQAQNIRIAQLEDSIQNVQKAVERLEAESILLQKEYSAAVKQAAKRPTPPPDTITDTLYLPVEVVKLAPCNSDSVAQAAAASAVQKYIAEQEALQLAPQQGEAIANTETKSIDINYLRQACERAKAQASNASGAASSKGFIASADVIATDNDYLYLVLVVENEGRGVVAISAPVLVGADTLQPIYCNIDKELADGDVKAVVAVYATTNIEAYKNIVISSSVATLSIKPKVKKAVKI